MKAWWSCIDTFIGEIYVAATSRGVYLVSIGNKELLFRRSSKIVGRTPEYCMKCLEEPILELEEYLRGYRRYFSVKLDPRGTSFMLKVWLETLKIPYGETRTYAWLAQAIGKARGARAVARALSLNPLPIFIPCHRVVSKNGLGGYSYGLDIKRKLLEIEIGNKI